jgi:RimJ/RimL family protein N-acetyltransferase
MEDAAFIVHLRTDPARSRFLHATSGDIQAQEHWIAEYLKRSDEYYFIIEEMCSGQPVGTISIYNYDRAANSAEWGRWVTLPRSAAGTAGLVLLLDLTFDQIEIDILYCHTIIENTKPRAIFERLGFQQVEIVPSYAQIGATVYEGLKFSVNRVEWHKRRLAQQPDVLSRNTCL